MKYLFLLLIFVGTEVQAQAQSASIKVLNFSELEPRLQTWNDSVYVVNFWATWCIPCRKELPEFEKIGKDFSNKPVKVLLVSLDFVKQIETSLKPFLEKNNIQQEVVLLNDPNSNDWINKVDSSWSGALPATLFLSKNRKIFVEAEMNTEQITNHINRLLTN